MKKQTAHKIVLLFAALAVLQITGCAGTDTSENDRRQGPPSMGHNGRGGQQGPAPSMARGTLDSDEGKTKKTPPAEAIAACMEKKPGEHVEFTGPGGETVKAVCREYDDHLVAIPEDLISKNSNRL
ncbi:MAG: hypothetical protein WBB19_04880 [Desulforhopalus sp.]